jgi:holo-[acyl-carrier protein] synthase
VGVDIVHTPRIARLISRYPHRLDRIFTKEELEYALSRKRPEEHLSARFAAKEAVAKVLRMRPRFREVEIIRRKGGAPELKFAGKTSDLASAFLWDLSLAHDGEYAIATVIALRREL